MQLLKKVLYSKCPSYEKQSYAYTGCIINIHMCIENKHFELEDINCYWKTAIRKVGSLICGSRSSGKSTVRCMLVPHLSLVLYPTSFTAPLLKRRTRDILAEFHRAVWISGFIVDFLYPLYANAYLLTKN